MQPAKQEALQTIAKMPEDVDMEEIMYQLYALEKVRRGIGCAEGRSASSTRLSTDALCKLSSSYLASDLRR